MFAPQTNLYSRFRASSNSAGCLVCACVCDSRQRIGECAFCPTVRLWHCVILLIVGHVRIPTVTFSYYYFFMYYSMFFVIHKVVYRFQCHRKSVFRRIKCLRWYWSHFRELCVFSLVIQIFIRFRKSIIFNSIRFFSFFFLFFFSFLPLELFGRRQLPARAHFSFL